VHLKSFSRIDTTKTSAHAPRGMLSWAPLPSQHEDERLPASPDRVHSRRLLPKTSQPGSHALARPWTRPLYYSSGQLMKRSLNDTSIPDTQNRHEHASQPQRIHNFIAHATEKSPQTIIPASYAPSSSGSSGQQSSYHPNHIILQRPPPVDLQQALPSKPTSSTALPHALRTVHSSSVDHNGRVITYPLGLPHRRHRMLRCYPRNHIWWIIAIISLGHGIKKRQREGAAITVGVWHLIPLRRNQQGEPTS